MATQTPSQPHATREQRARLTLDIAPALHTRLKIVAAQQHVAMRDIVEQMLEQALPNLDQLSAGTRLDLRQSPAVSRASSDTLRRMRQSLMRGRVFPESSADLLH